MKKRVLYYKGEQCMNSKIVYSLGLLLLVVLVFVGIVRQRSTLKSASTQTPSSATPINDQPVALGTGAVIPTSTPIFTNGGLILTISSPTSGQTVSTAKITIVGKTSPRAEVFINDEELLADATGNFSLSLTLEEGENYILVVANDADGKYVEKELSITYTPA